MIQINLIRDKKIAKVAGTKAPGAGFSFSIPKLPFNLPILLSVLGFLVVLLVVGLTFLSQRAKVAMLQNKITTYNSELAKLAGPKRMVDEYIQKVNDLSTKKREIETIDQGRFNRVKLLDAISRAMPEHLWLTLLDEDGANVKLDGYTFSNLIVAEFMESLKATGYLENVELTVAQKSDQAGREVVKFSLTGKINFTPALENAAAVEVAAGKGKP